MTHRIQPSMAIALFALILGCGSETGTGGGSGPTFGDLDTNLDGVLQKTEWLGAGYSGALFEGADFDGDGVLSVQEFNGIDFNALPDDDATTGEETGDITGSETDGEDATNPETGGECDGADSAMDTADFWMVYGLRGRVPGENLDDSELFIMDAQGRNPLDPTDPKPLSVTDFSLKGEQFQWCQESEPWEVSCKRGCQVDSSLQWIAVGLPVPAPENLDPDNDLFDPSLTCLTESDEPPSAQEGFSIWLGQLDHALKAKMIKGAILKNVAHFTFAGGKMFYSKKVDCVGPSCWYDIYQVDLTVNVNEATKLASFPPQEDIADSIYKGFFHVSSDGQMISLLNPTIRSQTYYVWSSGTIHKLKLLCQQRQNGKCIGTGSHYSDQDPTALSPDNEAMVTFTIAESNQRAWHYKTQTTAEPLWSNVVTTPPGTDYWSNACQHITQPWQYREVEQLQFTDDESILFLGRSEGCTGVGTKASTDILEIPIDVIGNGKPIQEGDIDNITENPKTTTATNVVIGSFDQCPGGDLLAFTGTPSFDANGVPLDNNNQATLTDRELYLITRDGCLKKQMTKDVTWEVNSVKCLPPKAPPGQ